MPSNKLRVVLPLCLSIILITSLALPVAAQADIRSELTVGGTNISPEVTAGESTPIKSRASIPDAPIASYSADLEFAAYVDNKQVAVQPISVQDGQDVDVDVSHEFQDLGQKDVYFEVTGEITRQGIGRSRSINIDRTTSTVSVNVLPRTETIDGASFTIPESIQEEVDETRSQNSRINGVNAFILTSSDETNIVFSNKTPEEGSATVEGFSPNVDPINQEGVEFGVIVASNVEFNQPVTTTVGDVYQNTDEYDREFVQIEAYHRSIAVDFENTSYSATAGVLTDNPLGSSDLFSNVGNNSRTQVTNPQSSTTRAVLGEIPQERLFTTSFSTEYWESEELTVNGITARPGTPTETFIRTFRNNTILPSGSGTPLMYIVDKEYNSRELSSISDVSGSLNGEIVTVESNLYMETISTKRVVETATSSPLPPVDVILHGGAAWNQIPTQRDDALLIMGASSAEQLQLRDSERGTYQLTGEVVSTDRVEGNLPEGSVLIIYDATRTGPLETAAINDLTQTRASVVSDTLERQANESEFPDSFGESPTVQIQSIDVSGLSTQTSAPVDITIEETAGVVAEEVNVSLSIRSSAGELVDSKTIDIENVDSRSTVTFGVTGDSDKVGPLPTEGEYDVTAMVQFAPGDTISTTKSITVTESTMPTGPTERVLQITGKSDPSGLSQNDVTATITRFNRGGSVNGVTVTQNDVTVMITLFERS